MTTAHEWICAHDISANSNFHLLLEQLWEQVREASHGRMTVRLHPDGALGGPDELVDGMIGNRIQVHPVSGMILSRITPIVAAEGMPFAFRTSAEGCQAMAGRTGDAVRAALRAQGIHALRQVLPQGLNQIFSRGRRIDTVEDLEGFRIRIGNSPYLKDLYRSLGCDPQPIDLQHVAAALRDGRADGMEITDYGAQSGRRDEVIDHVALCDIRFACFWMCFNAHAWDSLDGELQSLIERRYEALAEPYIAAVDHTNQASRQSLRDRGLTYTNVDRSSLQRRLHDSGFFARWRAQLGEPAWQSIEAYRTDRTA